MRIFVTLAVGLAVTMSCAAVAAGQPGAAKPQPDAAAIREVVKQYVDARERNDVEAVEKLFTKDADQLTSSGEWRRGRDEVVKGAMASSARTGGTRTITIETVRFPAAGVAIADGRYEIAGLPGAEARKMWAAFVMTKEQDGWRIAAIRNMLPAPAAPAAAPPPK